jgi:hypothetical protein
VQHEIVVPGVELLESMRSVGYTFEAAVADLVDNSISARATAVEVVGDPVDATFVYVLDDGLGMTPSEARQALQLAGSAPSRARDANDLGRFGLGLKTASLSQARKLTVVSKREGETTALQWDIDHVLSTGTWSLIVLDELERERLPGADAIAARASGTLVVWQELDYMLAGAVKPAQVMAERLEALREHLALTFHRFLEDRARDGIRIDVNGLQVQSLDPFLAKNPKTQLSAVERFTVGGQEVSFQAFTLPHTSAISGQDKKRWDLTTGMRERQGFYIYRNRRLIDYGHWYGLARRDELGKQSRIRVDIPNTADHLWQLDIKKSRAEPPQAFRAQFRRVIDRVLTKSRRVHTFRGRREVDKSIEHIWNKITDRGGFRYEINRQHPVVKSVSGDLDENHRDQFLLLLNVIASSFPVADLYLEMAKETPSTARRPTEEDLVGQLRGLRQTHVFEAMSSAQIAAILKTIEPFNEVEELSALIQFAWSEKP